MIKYCFAVGLCLLSYGSLQAQAGKITSASLSFNEGKYNDAIRDAQQGLSDPALKPKQTLKGNSILLRSILTLYNQTNNDQEKIKSFYAKHPTALDDGFGAFAKLYNLDPATGKSLGAAPVENKEYQDEVKGTVVLLGNMLYFKSFDARDANNHPEAIKLLTKADQAYNAAGLKMHYTHQLRGFSRLESRSKEDSLAAIADFEKAIEYYKKPAKEEGPGVAPSYAMLIRIYGRTKGDLQKALDVAAKGKAAYASNEDINNAELDIYLIPSLFDQALTKFKDEIAKKPNDAQALKVYANLLERKAAGLEKKGGSATEIQALQDEAVTLYEKVVQVGNTADKAFANFNVGAIFYNRSIGLQKKIDELPISKKKEADALAAEKKALLEKSFPYMKAAHELEPKNAETLRVLKDIALALNDEAGFTKYNDLYKKATGQ
jgi:tetratricopeptide (TPR) repeat protein